MKIRQIFFSILFFISICLSTKAETHMLDLNASIAIAKLKNFDMLTLKQNLKIAEYRLKSSTSKLKTHIDLVLTLPNYSQQLSQFEDSTGLNYFAKNQLSNSADIDIYQPLPTNGRISLRSGISTLLDYQNSDQILNMYTSLIFVQPIDALYGYNSVKSDIRKAKLGYELSQKNYNRGELQIVYDVSNSFYDLLSFQKRAEIDKMNLERQQEAYEIAKNKYDAGLIREVDALQMEVDLAEAQNRYDLTLIEQISAQNDFKKMIGVDLGDSIVLSSNFTYREVFVDINKALEMALENRLEIREQEIVIEQRKIDLKSIRSDGMIKSNFITSFRKNGYDKSPDSNDLMYSLNNSFNDFTEGKVNFSVGLTLNIPIVDWGENRALTNAAEARLQQQLYYKEEVRRVIETEVRNLVAKFNSSLKRLKLLEKNVLVAEKSFEITRARFSDGDIDSQTLALERERLNNAYNTHLSAYKEYELKLAELMLKTFYDFKNDRPIL